MSKDQFAKSTWAYRLVRDPDTGDMEVCEVYTRKDNGKHHGWTGPITLHGETVEEVRTNFLRVARALVEPVLTPDPAGNHLMEWTK